MKKISHTRDGALVSVERQIDAQICVIFILKLAIIERFFRNLNFTKFTDGFLDADK